MKKLILTLIFSFITFSLQAQSIAITIDDVPNTKLYKENNFNSIFLNKLDFNKIPATIFINEKLVYGTDHMDENFSLLNRWIHNRFITVGNHTFDHPWYSQVGFESFCLNVMQGEAISRQLTNKYEKELKYFRFPFNDLGKDSVQHLQIREFLESKDYQITPFTVESSDWMFSYIYEHYLISGEKQKAKEIAEAYIQKTLDLFDFFDSVALEQYGRKIDHIYLCHDNKLNSDYISILISKLKQKGYTFASLDEVLKDKIYSQPDNYYKKWGISWIYRWMKDAKERNTLMKKEPSILEYHDVYRSLTELNKNKKY